jgi:hypothetical protein
MEGIQTWRALHAHLLTTNLKAKPREKDFTFMMVMAYSYLSKPQGKTVALPLSTSGKQQPN